MNNSGTNQRWQMVVDMQLILTWYDTQLGQQEEVTK